MTLPNKLTFTRILLTPVIYFTLKSLSLASFFPWGLYLIWLLFLVAELSDFLDGYLARSRNIVSEEGKLLDPLGDVLMRLTFFSVFVSDGLMPLTPFMIILWREIAILMLRMVLLRENRVVQANIFGKLKAVVYMLSNLGGLLFITLEYLEAKLSFLLLFRKILIGLFITSAVFSFLSFLSYLPYYFQSRFHQNFIRKTPSPAPSEKPEP